MRRVLCLTPFLALVTAAQRLVSRTSRNERVYHFIGKSWVMTVSVFCWLSIGFAYDSSGPQLAESLATPLGLLAVSCAGALLGAQGALLNLSTETRLQVAVIVFASTLLKLHQCQSPAYRLVQLCVVLPFALGFAWTPRSAARAATSQAANVVMRAADAVREPFLVTGTDMHILAVNVHFTELLGYEVGEVLGQPMTMLIADAPDVQDHDRWLAHFSKGCGSTPQSKRGHVRSVLTKKSEWLPMRIFLGETRCALNGTRFFTAELCSLALEHRNARLVAEKERLEWEVGWRHGDANDPRKALGEWHPISGPARRSTSSPPTVPSARCKIRGLPTTPSRAPAPVTTTRTRSTLSTQLGQRRLVHLTTCLLRGVLSWTRRPPPPGAQKPHLCSLPKWIR